MFLVSSCSGLVVQENVNESVPFPRESLTPKLVVQTGHAKEVSSVAFSPDGEIVVSASGDDTVKLWHVSTGKELHTLTGHTRGVATVAFSPNGHLVASGSRDTKIIIWNSYTGEKLHTLIGHHDWIASVAFSPNGKLLASGSKDGMIKLWDVQAGQELGTLKGHTKEVSSIAFRPDSRVLASGSWDGTIKLWNLRTGKELRTLEGYAREIFSIAFHPQDNLLASASSDGTITLWDPRTGKKIRALQGHDRAVVSVTFSSDGRILASGGREQQITLWDIYTGEEVLTFSEQAKGVGIVALSPDDKLLARGIGDGQIKLWDASTGEEIRTLTGNSVGIVSVKFSPDGYTLAGVGWDDTVKLWDMRGQNLRSFVGHTESVKSVAFSPDGLILASSSDDQTIKLWDVGTGEVRSTLEGHAQSVQIVAFSPNAPLLASGSWDKSIKLWDLNSAQELQTLSGHSEPVLSVVFSPDGQLLASGSSDGTLKLWDVKKGREIRTFIGHTDWIRTVVFSPDGHTLASGGGDNTVKLWDVHTGEELHTFAGHTYGIFSLVFSPDGNRIASGSGDNTIRLWDVRSGKELRTLKGHSFWVFSVDFNPDGTLLASGSLDKQIKLWDPENGQEIVSLIALGDDDWAAVTPQGQFDASFGAMDLTHWIIGLEPVELIQLKDRYYDPGLLQKLLGLNQESVRVVPELADVKLYPDLRLLQHDATSPKASLLLTNQGGGIGRVTVMINGKEVTADARGLTLESQASQARLDLDFTDHPFLIPGEQNLVQVTAYNTDGYLVSRPLSFECIPPRKLTEESALVPHLWAIVVGISDYEEAFLDLQFAAKDAEDFAHALQLGAERFLGENNVHITLLTSPTGAQTSGLPTRQNLIHAFEAARQAKSTDLLVVYLAGHGVNHGGIEGDYYYPTSEAYTENLADPAIRSQTTLSSKELTDLIRQVPALKQILILDTCMSGRVIETLSAQRSIPSSQIRALERMKDRMGLYILAGSAADAVSYETSRYGQGLLTYSLLMGMRGAALREGKFIDVGTLFDFVADQVPQLAKDIGGIQRPVVATPYGGTSFDIGILTSEDKEQIPLAKVRPLVLRANFQDEEPPFHDHLALTMRVNDSLRKLSAQGSDAPIVFIDASEFPDAYFLSGRYTIKDERVIVTMYVLQDRNIIEQFSVEGDPMDLDGLTNTIAATLGYKFGRAEAEITTVAIRTK